MDVQFISPRFKVNIAKGLKATGFQIGELDENTTISGETLKVGMALPIQTGAHLFNLKICHITETSAQSAFMGTRRAKLKALNQTSLWQHLAWCTYNFTKAKLTCKYADNMSAARNPDMGLVFLGS